MYTSCSTSVKHLPVTAQKYFVIFWLMFMLQTTGISISVVLCSLTILSTFSYSYNMFSLTLF